jgi:hypothetical protein
MPDTVPAPEHDFAADVTADPDIAASHFLHAARLFAAAGIAAMPEQARDALAVYANSGRADIGINVSLTDPPTIAAYADITDVTGRRERVELFNLETETAPRTVQ